MKIVDKIKNIIKIDRKKDGYSLKEIGEFLGLTGIDVENIEQSSDLSETIYFICLKHLSETMAKMPWEKRVLTEKKGKERVLDSKIDNLLNIRPNPYMTATTFWGTVELNKLHYGNSYIYIEADKNGFPRYLWLLPSDQMEIWIDNRGILGSLNAVWYVWTDQRNGKKYTFEMDEIIHLKTHISFDGLSGAPIKDILKTQISSGKNSIGFLNKLYKNNMFGSKVLVQYTGELNKAAEEKLAKKIESFAKAQGSGKFIPMPFGMQA